MAVLLTNPAIFGVNCEAYSLVVLFGSIFNQNEKTATSATRGQIELPDVV